MHHQIKKHLLFSALSFLIAILWYIHHNQWVLITIPQTNIATLSYSTTLCKKEITLHYFRNKWHSTLQEVLWSKSVSDNAYQLINTWLTFLEDEDILHKKITLQTALLSSDNTLYLSFDANFLPKTETIFNKWMLIEGLLKTITANDIPVQRIQFLVHHQPLIDHHIDFSEPWPVNGFLH